MRESHLRRQSGRKVRSGRRRKQAQEAHGAAWAGSRRRHKLHSCAGIFTFARPAMVHFSAPHTGIMATIFILYLDLQTCLLQQQIVPQSMYSADHL